MIFNRTCELVDLFVGTWLLNGPHNGKGGFKMIEYLLALVYGGKRLLFGTLSDRVWQLKGVLAMATNVKLSDDLVKAAGRIAAIEHRSIPKQIEFYFKIAAIAEVNPDLSFSLIKEILKSDAETTAGHYAFG